MPVARTPYRIILLRAIRLRCPRCGQGKLFRRWFRMYSACDVCGLNYEREPGFYLGSIYVNYGITAVLGLTAFLVGIKWDVPQDSLMFGVMAFCLVFPVLIFRHARAIWLAFDQFWDPQEKQDGEAE